MLSSAPQDKWVLFGVCAGCGSVTPLGERQLLCHRFPSRGRGTRQKALFVLRKVSGTRRAGAELGLFIRREACRLRNAGSRLELAGSCLRWAWQVRDEAHSLPALTRGCLWAEGSRSGVPSVGTQG